MSNVRFIYLRNSAGVPEACVAYETVGIESDLGIRFGVSVHNPADKWDRKVARYVAAGALLLEPKVFSISRNERAANVIADVIAHGGGFPTRAKKAAKIWLKAANATKPNTLAALLDDSDYDGTSNRCNAV